MFSFTYTTLAEALKQVRKDSPRQFAVAQQKDELEQLVWVYSRSTEFAKI